MANVLSRNEKVQLVAAAVADNLDYVRSSVSKLDQSQLKNKKLGMSYKLYVPAPGTVQEGLKAVPDDLVETETEITLQNFNTSCRIDAFEDLTGIEDFTREIAKPKGTLLARSIQKNVVEKNVFKNMQSVVAAAPSFEVLSDASSALGELAIGGDLVSFMHPTVMGKIANSGLGQFQPSAAASELYSKNFLGVYAGADQVQLPVLPVLKTPSTMPSATISLTPITDADSNVIGFEVVDQISGTGFVPGLIYKADGLKIVDPSGLPTDQDVTITVLDSAGHINPLRITMEGFATGNPNAWVPTGTSSLTLTAGLEADTKYWVGQVRTRDTSLVYDAYKFSKLPGSETQEIATVGGVSVKMSRFGDGEVLEELIRFDAPFAAGIYEPRNCCGVYIAQG